MKKQTPTLVLLLVAVFGPILASCGPPRAAEGPPETRPTPGAGASVWRDYQEGRVTFVQPDVVRVSHDISAPPQQVWAALIQVYQELGIEMEGVNAASLTLSNPNLVVSRRLGGERLSRYLGCGTGLTGALADSYRIQINLFSQVKPAAAGQSVLETTMQAFGTNPDGSSNTRVPCTSSHGLENRIAAAVAERVR